ncbi:MAG TPA: allophanate hydrolase subunit 1 [Intrasporangium sp.]|uniref:5-oxoprolinase subunit B family protein n=1 Tax=Intrasporangium sp. TaxID=1925024 RepID=UPI002D77FF51|nr:allophanate hydrolase subunit 1 [Intrasporangium sp.]HET7399924.1 allophanate hydrolase subunit 1 [Intrasporangium sp.]
MRLLPCGDRAVLVELEDGPARRRLDAALRRHPLPDVVEHVPGARTVLVRASAPDALPGVVAALRLLRWEDVEEEPGTAAAEVVQLPVRYDGEDLDEVARLLGVAPEEVVRRHTGQQWTVEFCGFMPGFGYLVGDAGGLEVPRRTSPRTRIPTGAVALAGAFTGVYPRPSPGGWQLIGTTDAVLWDPDRQPPALFAPGTRVRFVEVGDA